jgi:hypothetical protein
MLGYDNLMNHFRTNFSLMQHHKYSLHEIEGMIPWEKQIYIDMLHQHIKNLEDQAKQRQNEMKAQIRR